MRWYGGVCESGRARDHFGVDARRDGKKRVEPSELETIELSKPCGKQ